MGQRLHPAGRAGAKELLPFSSARSGPWGLGRKGWARSWHAAAIVAVCHTRLSEQGPPGEILQQKPLPSQLATTPMGPTASSECSGEPGGPGGTFPLVEVLHEQKTSCRSFPGRANTPAAVGPGSPLLNPYGTELPVSSAGSCSGNVGLERDDL